MRISLSLYKRCIVAAGFLLITICSFANETIYYGPTKANERLFDIASQVVAATGRTNNPTISTEQIMLSLLEANPLAFTVKNVNALKPDNILKVPDLSTISLINTTAAAVEVKKQDQEWQNSGHTLTPKSPAISNAKHEDNVVGTLAALTNMVPTLPDENQNITISKKELDEVKQQFLTNLAVLEYKNNVLQTQMLMLDQQVLQLGQQVVNVHQVINKNKFTWHVVSAVDNTVKYWEKRLGRSMWAVAIIGTVVVVFVSARILILRRRKQSLVKNELQQPSVRVSKDDYDFMHSDDSLPSKLNLAQAYIDMGDKKTAQELLQEVMVKGNIAQQAEAKTLLDKLLST